MNAFRLPRIFAADQGQIQRPGRNLAIASLSMALSFLLADAAQGACRFKIESESGHLAAVAQALPEFQNGQIEFRFSGASSGGYLEVRFRPDGKFKPRFTPPEVIRQLKDEQPIAWFNQKRHEVARSAQAIAPL